MAARTVLSVSLPPRMRREVERLAKREHRTLSELVREALRRHLWDSRRPERLAIGRRLTAQFGIGPEAEDWDPIVHEHRASRRRS